MEVAVEGRHPMRRLLIGAAVTGLVMAPSAVGAQAGLDDYCLAVNPVQPTCTFTVQDSATTPVTGAAGRGDWIVIVKRGKVKTAIKSPSSGEPTATSYTLLAGDKVTAKALSPGSGVLAGDV
jgi:hypothetical protein